MNLFSERVEAVRRIMRRQGWDAVILTGTDPHSSEYSAPRWHPVGWVTGYTGEGDLVITLDHAGVWTDTRYFIQAERELHGSGVELHKTRVPEQVLIPEWLPGHFSSFENVVVALDGQSQSVSSVLDIRNAFLAQGFEENGKGSRAFTIANASNFLDEIWLDRPPVPQTPVITLGTEQVGWSRKQKIDWLRKWMQERGHDALLLTALDQIAWMLNVRGQDVQYNPVVISYLLMTLDSVQWFVRKGPIPAEDSETEDSFYELTADGVNIQDYDEVKSALVGMVRDDEVSRLFLDSASLNYDLYRALSDHATHAELELGKSPVILRKAVKNEVEIAGMREAHFEDGVAMEKFLYWLEMSVRNGDAVNEYEAARKIHALRAEIPGFRGESFETISAYGPNAALPHYVTPVEGSAELYPKGLYLCDSGGQYLFGTTDITRTIPLGPCTPLEKEDYTLVLKGHIGLAKTVFPKGTACCRIDALARVPLWNSMRDFGHGTGHGVGFYLNVHEGPQGLRQDLNHQPLMPGMTTTNEPGIYREGQHGVRHENVYLTVDAGRNDFGSWLRSEPLTLCHFDTGILVPDLLDRDEINWLNQYNARVFETLAPHLPAEVADWLRDKTRPVG